MLTVAVARSSYDDNAMLCTSGFADDVMFYHNGASGPDTNTTRMFRRVRQVTADTSDTGGGVAVYDCRLVLCCESLTESLCTVYHSLT